MKLRVCIITFLLIVSCIYSNGGFSDLQLSHVLAYINIARGAKGLSLVSESRALNRTAYYYASMMESMKTVSHDLMSWHDKEEVVYVNSARFYETWYADGGFTIHECLAFVARSNINGLSDLEEANYIAHVFDDSPEHAYAVYHKDAVYAGWGGIAFMPDGLWLCLYIVTKP